MQLPRFQLVREFSLGCTSSRALLLAAPVALLLLAGCGPSPTPVNTLPETNAPAPSLSPLATNAVSPTGTPSGSTGNGDDWTTYHRDNARSGYVPDMADPQQLAVAWKTQLDGAVYAEPLVVDGHIIVATENNSLYSLNADTGQVDWQTHVGDPATGSELPCGNIDPLGITGTPVYDAASGLVFAVAEVSGPAHLLVGVDARTGEVQVRRPADVPGMEPAPQQQRAALALSNGMVYIAYGGLFGDCGNYRGTVIASRTDGGGELLSYRVTTPREGGIWAAAGPVVDAAGHVYVSVGNGSTVSGEWDHSDSVLRLSRILQLEDSFAPEQWAQDNARDADLGSLSPVLLPNDLIFIAGKSGTGYTLDANALGGVGGQLQSQTVCHAYGGAALVGSTLFVPCNEGVQEIQVSADGNFTLGWRAANVPGSPVIGGHTVYTLERNGTLHALDIESGRDRTAPVGVGATSRFATPTLFQNQIFIGTLAGVVAVTLK
jgi:outer membrane protein assembly factor BamB